MNLVSIKYEISLDSFIITDMFGNKTVHPWTKELNKVACIDNSCDMDMWENIKDKWVGIKEMARTY